MEMLVIAGVVLIAFAAVLLPLFRRRPGVGDEREFENITPADVSAAEPSAARITEPPPATGLTAESPAADPLESAVMRYRDAVRSGTVCRKCGQANPADSLYCFECGTRLPRADAKEFE